MSYRPRRRWAALLLAVLIAVALAVPITVVGLAGRGPAPAPVAPILAPAPAPVAPVRGAEAIPAVTTASPDVIDRAPVTVISTTGDSVEAQSPAESPGGGVQPVRKAGGARAGVDMDR